MQPNNHIYTIQDIYTKAPIEQATDRLTNQTSFVVNFFNAYQMAEVREVDSIAEIKCKYCKGFYFPVVNQVSMKQNYYAGYVKNRLSSKGGVSEPKDQSKFVCGLCGAVNDIRQDSSLNKLPEFDDIKQKHKQWPQNNQINKFRSCFQSLMISQKQKDSVIHQKSYPKHHNTHNNHKQNSISFLFFLDISSLNQSIIEPIVTYLKTVIREYCSRNLDQTQTNPQIQDTTITQPQQKAQKQISQQYRLILALNLNDSLHLSDLNTLSTISIESLLKQKILSSISTQNTPEMYQKQHQRKESLIKLVNQCSVNLSEFQSWDNADEYLDMVLDDIGEDHQMNENLKIRHGINGIKNYNMLMELLAVDKDLSRSYIMTYIGGSPLLNYEPHRVSKSTIYSMCYIFYQPTKQTYTQNLHSSNNSQSVTNFSPIASTKPHLSNLKNQILLIKDNHEVYFLPNHEQGLQQFYYQLYQLLGITEIPKMFKPKWSIKTDNKYPPILSNEFPGFFIKPTSVLLFIISCLINTSGNHNRFQISVMFEDQRGRQKLWLINFTKDMRKELHELNQLYKMNNSQLNPTQQVQPFGLIHKLPVIYNYLYILSKFAVGVCIRGRNDLTVSRSNQSQKSMFTLNTITSHQICVLFQSIINFGVFKLGTVQISSQYVQNLYDYCVGIKNVSYEILKFLSTCETNPRKAAEMIYPLLVRNYSQENSSCIVYWGDGYYCLNDHSQDQNSQDEDWYVQFIDSHQQLQASYYTKRCHYQTHKNSDENQLIKFYLKKLQINPNKLHSYLPVYFRGQNQ